MDKKGRRCEAVTDPPLYPGTKTETATVWKRREGSVSRMIRESEDLPKSVVPEVTFAD